MKKYIVKQTVAHNGKPEKTATFTVQADTEVQADLIISKLDGKVEVYEMSSTLGSPAGTTASTSLKIVDSIRFTSPVAKTVYISAFNRGIVFDSAVNLENLMAELGTTFEPFGDLHPALKPAADYDYGDPRKM